MLEWEGTEPSFRPQQMRRMSAPIMNQAARAAEKEARGPAEETPITRGNASLVSPRSVGKARTGGATVGRRGRRASVGGAGPAPPRGAKKGAQSAASDPDGDANGNGDGGEGVDPADVGISLPPEAVRGGDARAPSTVNDAPQEQQQQQQRAKPPD